MWLIDSFHAVLFGVLLVQGVMLPFASPTDWYLVSAIWLAMATYLGILIGASRSQIVCVWLSVLPPAGIFLWTAPNVIYNFWAFATGAQIYQDSPSTIFVVAIMAIFLTIPSAATLGAYWRQRGRLFVPADN